MGKWNGYAPSKVVMSRTPLRVSFAGGGTDLPAFYRRDYGAVLSTAIDKYIYVTVKRHGDVFDERVRVTYSKSERVTRIDEVENDIARECLRLLEIDPPIYICTIADLPSSTGLGGIEQLRRRAAQRAPRLSRRAGIAGQLAEEASHIEIDVLKQPIGKQDQYAAAYGGLNYFRFEHDNRVMVEPQRLPNSEVDALFDSAMMFLDRSPARLRLGPDRAEREHSSGTWSRCCNCVSTPIDCTP